MQNLSWTSRNRQRRKNKKIPIIRTILAAIGRVSIPLTLILVLFVLGATLMPVVEDTQVTVVTVDPIESIESTEDVVFETRKERLEQMIRDAAEEYGVDPDEAVWIAQCESSLNERAANGISSAKGLFQHTDGTWEQIKAQGHQYDAEENIKQFMIWYPIYPGWWECVYER